MSRSTLCIDCSTSLEFAFNSLSVPVGRVASVPYRDRVTGRVRHVSCERHPYFFRTHHPPFKIGGQMPARLIECSRGIFDLPALFLAFSHLHAPSAPFRVPLWGKLSFNEANHSPLDASRVCAALDRLFPVKNNVSCDGR